MENVILNRTIKYIRIFCKLLVLSIVIGCICGLVGSCFRIVTDEAANFLGLNNNLIYGLPFVGLVIVFLYRKCNLATRGDTNRIIDSLRTYDSIPILMAPLIFIGTTLTHLCGGSSGKEGAALQMGGSIGFWFGERLKLSNNGRRVLTMCGMSSLFATFFQTPLTATIFSMEIIDVGVMHYSAFMPCIISSIVAILVSRAIGLNGLKIENIEFPALDLEVLVKVIGISLVCVIVSILFCYILKVVHEKSKEYVKDDYVRIVIGGMLIIALTLLVGNVRYNGPGMGYVVEAFSQNAKLEDWILKIIFTAITLGTGFKGGEIVPSFFIGATLGNILGGFFNLNIGFAAAIGLVSLFCACCNSPITSLVLSVELFGAEGLTYFALAASIAYILSGYTSLYDSQKILYSKMESEKDNDRVIVKENEVVAKKKWYQKINLKLKK